MEQKKHMLKKTKLENFLMYQLKEKESNRKITHDTMQREVNFSIFINPRHPPNFFLPL